MLISGFGAMYVPRSFGVAPHALRISLRITLNRRGWIRTNKGMNLKPLFIPAVAGRIKRPSLGACHGTQRAARIRHIRLPFG